MSNPIPNTDEGLTGFIGNFHKTLPHDEYGVVDAKAYAHFRQTCLEVEAGKPDDFENVARGTVPPGGAFAPGADGSAAALNNPLAGAAGESHAPAPSTLEMGPAPGILSLSSAAEMAELYWMALMRDLPLADLQLAAPPDMVTQAVTELADRFTEAVQDTSDAGRLALGRDLPSAGGKLDIRVQTLFRCGLPGEAHGPLVSQFFLRDVPYGVQTIDQSLIPYAADYDHLVTYDDWMRAQNTGKDQFGRSYGSCNYHADNPGYYGTQRRKISTVRDLARFVNRDALHQAYFNAALFLDAVGAPPDRGNPYANGSYRRQGGFATLGGPDLLTLVSEVASRALKAVWRQKWLVHRRARPEVYGGLIEMQEVGPPGLGTRPFGIPKAILHSKARKAVLAKHGTSFLPMAYSAGSPTHPAYGAGHATVAGACVTVLKAWFDESATLQSVIAAAAGPGKEPPGSSSLELLSPGAPDPTGLDRYHPPSRYTGADAGLMTIGGELNKLASNVAMGRSMGGVHWRSDNTRSLRLGEAIAIEILRKRTAEYAEKAASFSFTSFDGNTVRISGGSVS